MNLRTKLGIIAVFVMSLTVLVQAEPVSQLHPGGYVNDFAHVLDQKTVAQLETICDQVDHKTHAQIAVVTINSLDGEDIDKYAFKLFNSWGIGNKATNRGVLILYAIKDHSSRIEVGYGMETILPNQNVGTFQQEAIPLMRGGNYSAALLLVTSRVVGAIAQDAGIEIPKVQSPDMTRKQSNPGTAFSAAGQNTMYAVKDGQTDSEGLPTTAAQLCTVSNGPQACYTPPSQNPPFGLNAKTQGVNLASGGRLALFSAESSTGGSESLIFIALLDNRTGTLNNLLPRVTLSNQSEYRAWSLPSVSSMPVVVTADYVLAKGETHLGHHRYTVNGYICDNTGRYVRRLQFVTDKKYPGLDEADALNVLESEKATILTRFSR